MDAPDATGLSTGHTGYRTRNGGCYTAGSAKFTTIHDKKVIKTSYYTNKSSILGRDCTNSLTFVDEQQTKEMRFKTELIEGQLIRRYKRFLAEVKLSDGTKVTAHCTNSGSMKSCIETGARVLLSEAADPNRKTKYTWEMIEINGQWVGINTMHPNLVVAEAIKQNQIARLTGYTDIRREITVNDSRLDIVASNSKETAFIEVKNVTYKDGDYALFPDAVTARGLKHLHNLMKIKQEGHRAVMVYAIQRADVSVFAPAKAIDAAYGNALKEAFDAGVEIFPVICRVTPSAIEIDRVIPFELD